MSEKNKLTLLLTVQCLIGCVMTLTCTWKRASSCYNVVDTDPKDFVAADSDCQATFGGHLVQFCQSMNASLGIYVNNQLLGVNQ